MKAQGKPFLSFVEAISQKLYLSGIGHHRFLPVHLQNSFFSMNGTMCSRVCLALALLPQKITISSAYRTKLCPLLFKKVTGISVTDFELLTSIGLFNESLMNDAIYKFRRYEEASLSYAGINRHEGEAVSGFSTVLEEDEYHEMYGAETGTPYLKVGDKVEVAGSGICTVTSVQKERFSVKDSKGKTTRYVYPNAFEYGTVKLHKK